MRKHGMGLATMVATSAGLALASSSYAAGIQAAGVASGLWVVLAILVGGVVTMATALNFSELAAMYPNAGGVQVYVRHAFGRAMSVTVTLLYVVLGWAGGSAESYIFAQALTYLARAGHVPVLSQVPPLAWVALTLAGFYVVNLFGVELAGMAQTVMTFSMIGLLIAVSIFAWTNASASDWHGVLTTPFPHWGFLMGIAYTVYMYVGFEWITPLSEDARDKRVVPRALPITVLILAVCYALFTGAMVLTVPLPDLAASPVPHMVFAQAFGGVPLVLIVGMISILATFTFFNGGMMGNSRLLYAMAREGILPKALSRVHLRFFTPWVALSFMFAVQFALSTVVTLTGAYVVPILLAALIESFVYALIGLTVFILRRREPATDRPVRVRGSVLALGSFVVFLALGVSLMFPPSPPAVPLIFFIAGTACFLYAHFVAPRFEERALRVAPRT